MYLHSKDREHDLFFTRDSLLSVIDVLRQSFSLFLYDDPDDDEQSLSVETHPSLCEIHELLPELFFLLKVLSVSSSLISLHTISWKTCRQLHHHQGSSREHEVAVHSQKRKTKFWEWNTTKRYCIHERAKFGVYFFRVSRCAKFIDCLPSFRAHETDSRKTICFSRIRRRKRAKTVYAQLRWNRYFILTFRSYCTSAAKFEFTVQSSWSRTLGIIVCMHPSGKDDEWIGRQDPI